MTSGQVLGDAAEARRRWVDPTLGTGERVAALLPVMTLEEKVGQLVQVANPDPERDAEALAAGTFGTAIVASGAYAGNVRDAGTQAALVNALQAAAGRSRLGIPLLVARDVIHGHRTVFPIPLGQAAAFDADLVRACARVAAVEASADGVRWTFAPMLDVGQDPRWGRVAEGFGEDAWLTSWLGAAAVEGFQGGARHGGPLAPDALAACAKHYVGYALAQGGRDYAEVDVGPVTLHNRHLRPFRAAVDAGVATVMSAFHSLDGTPMTAHAPLLRAHLKGDLGFAGPVVSDWDAVAELVPHGVAPDLRSAAALAVRAGVDIDMVSGGYRGHLAALVRAGEVDEALVDDAVARVLGLKVRLGLVEEPCTDVERARVHLAPEHRALARRAAASATVLLTNDGVLPLDPQDAPLHVHLTGPFATATDELFGTWTLDGRGEDVVTVADAFTESAAASGGRLTVTVDDARFSDATLIEARAADVVVACVGEHPRRSGEANSVTSLELPPGQLDLLEALARVSRRLVVVVLAGRPLALERVARVADAAVLVFHPGVEGGHGVVDVLTGAVPASGRLPASLPWVTGQVPVHHDALPTGRPLDPDGPEGRYRDHRDTPQLPFGFGLGYAPVSYEQVRASEPRVRAGAAVRVEAQLVNEGTRPVVETAQLYVRVPVSAVSRPVSELVGVQRVRLEPGESAWVAFELAHDALARLDAHGHPRFDGGAVTVRVGPHAGAGVTTTLLADPREDRSPESPET